MGDEQNKQEEIQAEGGEKAKAPETDYAAQIQALQARNDLLEQNMMLMRQNPPQGKTEEQPDPLSELDSTDNPDWNGVPAKTIKKVLTSLVQTVQSQINGIQTQVQGMSMFPDFNSKVMAKLPGILKTNPALADALRSNNPQLALKALVYQMCTAETAEKKAGKEGDINIEELAKRLERPPSAADVGKSEAMDNKTKQTIMKGTDEDFAKLVAQIEGMH